MPLYDYKCRECGRVSEIFLRSVNSEDIKYPNCGSNNLEKLISASYTIRMGAFMPGTTCCGRAERCETPPCSTDDRCWRT